ncbi:MAG: ComEA family DNA-binding protein [Candidatus Limnocylindria bacterium]
MESFPTDWHTIDDNPRVAAAAPTGGRWDARSTRVAAIAILIGGILGVLGVVFVASSAAPAELVIDGVDVTGLAAGTAGPGAGPVGGGVLATTSPSETVVDVEGAVVTPGLHRLPTGSRVGDAIAAAGGFSMRVDAAAAAATLNLAAPVADGDKVHVPLIGESVAIPPGSTAPGGQPPPGSGSSLIDLNAADGALLETLPGIGPVTAAAIIAARETAPFTSVDELRSRGVVGPSTFEKIKDLVTVGG